jgi:hypothetical protein
LGKKKEERGHIVRNTVWECGVNCILKKNKIFLLKIIIFYVLDRFDVLISKIIFKK